MDKKFEEDDEWKKLLEKQYIKEAEALEAALFSDGEFEDYEEESEEEVLASYNKLVERLKAEGIYREDEDSSPADAGSSGAAEEKTIPMPIPAAARTSKKAGRHYRFVKAAGFGFVGVLCVFAASMTSEANRTYFVKNVKYLVGDDTRIVMDNDNRNEADSGDEYQAIGDIESKLGVEVPEFLYRPRNFEFVYYEVDSFSKTARLEYLYEKNIISLFIDKENESTSSKLDSFPSDDTQKISIDVEGITVEIQQIKEKQDTMASSLAQWRQDNVLYKVYGRIELDELKKIIKNMTF
ncbi:MAG: DUF4367 domain-containing protein [Eubacteriales bacterium]|nr:DUF4367 domain-containing protein [Eubacteriales bacterium]